VPSASASITTRGAPFCSSVLGFTYTPATDSCPVCPVQQLRHLGLSSPTRVVVTGAADISAAAPVRDPANSTEVKLAVIPGKNSAINVQPGSRQGPSRSNLGYALRGRTESNPHDANCSPRASRGHKLPPANLQECATRLRSSLFSTF